MNRIFNYLPEIDMEESISLEALLKDKSEEQLRNFALMYRTRRRDPQLILLTSLLGLLGFAGVHRFLINHIGMGLLYFFTAGLCFIGTIIDAVNYRSLAMEYNLRVAREVLMYIG